MLFFITLLFAATKAQYDCVYYFGAGKLDLYQLKGQPPFRYYSSDNTEWTYSVCESGLSCSHDNQNSMAMIDHSPVGLSECFPWATYDAAVQPFFDIAIGSWVFNYSNGESCPTTQQINRTTTVLWTCDEDLTHPLMVDAYNYDECNVLLEIKWEGACIPPPPPNEHCEFRSPGFGGKKLNLSSVQGQTFSLTEINNIGHKFTYEYSPCNNSITCSSTNGYQFPVMADIRDGGGQCAKFLGIWSGDVTPYYDRTIFGQDYWEFFWMDGEECGEGNPLEVLNIRMYCNPSVPTMNITRAYNNGPCNFRIEIDSVLACTNMTDTVMSIQ